jgi:hypothetical protein
VNSKPVDSIIRRTGATTNPVFLAEGGNVPMLKSQTLAVAAVLVLTMSSGRGDKPPPQADTKEDRLRAIESSGRMAGEGMDAAKRAIVVVDGISASPSAVAHRNGRRAAINPVVVGKSLEMQ